MENNFLKHNNIIIEEVNNTTARVRLDITDNSLNPYKIVHGGLIFALGDTVMGAIVRFNGRNAVTADASINFLRPGIGKYLIAKGEVIKAGKNISVLRANIYNEEDKLIATMNGTYFLGD